MVFVRLIKSIDVMESFWHVPLHCECVTLDIDHWTFSNPHVTKRGLVCRVSVMFVQAVILLVFSRAYRRCLCFYVIVI